jgi:hypothetical protein
MRKDKKEKEVAGINRSSVHILSAHRKRDKRIEKRCQIEGKSWAST